MRFVSDDDASVEGWFNHGSYLEDRAGFRARAVNVPWLIVAAVIAIASAAVFVPIYVRALRSKQPKLVGPVLAYVAVFIVMVASAGATGSDHPPTDAGKRAKRHQPDRESQPSTDLGRDEVA